MTDPRSRFSRYSDVLTLHGARSFFLPAAVARLGVAMTGLGLLSTVHHGSGSLATAGAATGLFAAAEAVAGPQVARIVDRRGQGVVVPPVVIAHVAAVLVVVGAAGASTVLTMVAAAVAGATVPQPGALSAVRWPQVVRDPSQLRTAFSVEALVNDVVFLAGPVLATLVSTSFVPWAGSIAAAALLAGGCLVLSAQRRSAPAPARPASRARGRERLLTARPFLAVLGVNLGLGCFFGAVPLLATATAAAAHREALTGVVLALSSAASIVAGLVYGSTSTRLRPRDVQLIALLVLAVAVLIGVALPTITGIALMLLVGGATVAPLIASSSQIAHDVLGDGRWTQGFTWINTASATGIAGSAAITGVVLAHAGTRAATTVLVGLVVVAAVSAALSRSALPTQGRTRRGAAGLRSDRRAP